jgi:transcriptional regulator with XRE-family HTH domain
METTVTHAIRIPAAPATPAVAKPVLLRDVIGEQLRVARQGQHRTLRDVSSAARVSLGYLSEVERGQKEASSELLGAICSALGMTVGDLLIDVSAEVAKRESKFDRVLRAR